MSISTLYRRRFIIQTNKRIWIESRNVTISAPTRFLCNTKRPGFFFYISIFLFLNEDIYFLPPLHTIRMDI